MILSISLDYPIPEVQDFGRRPTTPKCISALLYLIDKYSTGNILEIGTWYGKTTYELAVRYPDKTVYTIDYIGKDLKLNPEINRGLIKEKKELCKYAKKLKNVKFLYKDSKKFNFNSFKEVDFIFIDGDHSFEGALKDTQKSIKYLEENKGGIIAFHDIRVGHTEIPKLMRYLSDNIGYIVHFFINTNVGFIKIKK